MVRQLKDRLGLHVFRFLGLHAFLIWSSVWLFAFLLHGGLCCLTTTTPSFGAGLNQTIPILYHSSVICNLIDIFLEPLPV